ncbi:tyrosine-protein phosphatase [Singulisphaera sp. PoT]|uniref:tyrosine-protein phosphatase n=1 Tax=Singulisphaera sp. PoT TaxID=3411797 RepID=UPI003BF51074
MDQRDEKTLRRRRRRIIILATLAILGVGATTTFRNPLFWGNFGVVASGRVYRSAQPNANLDALVDEHRLASILNLRGGSPSDSFYANEVRVVHDRKVDFYDFPMSATRRPSRRELLTLLDLFSRCRYPLLIHCKSGSDRTGLASGLYLLSQAAQAPKQAAGAFSLYYGHVPLGGTALLHAPFIEYERWLIEKSLNHNPQRFRSWVENEYEPDATSSTFEPLAPGPRPPSLKLSARWSRRLARAGLSTVH